MAAVNGNRFLPWWTAADGMSQRREGPIMKRSDWLTTQEIGEVFAEEVAAAGGEVSDRFDDGARLFLRAVLPEQREVRSGDRLQGGVALRATPEEIWVHPYVFRQVCSNGAIRAHALQSQRLERTDWSRGPAPEVESSLREAVRACCADHVFECGVHEMRSSIDSNVDFALNMMPMLSRLLKSDVPPEIYKEILNQFFGSRDKSRFGFMNAVTSVARDTRDPEVRWRLETLGGGAPVEDLEAKHQGRRARETVLQRA
jgi:hypothetical protein